MTLQLLKDTLAVLSLGKLCEGHGYTDEWASGQKPHLTKDGKKNLRKMENFVPVVVPGLSSNIGASSSSDKDNKGAAGDSLRDLLEWLQEFTEDLEDTEVAAPAHISHDSDLQVV